MSKETIKVFACGNSWGIGTYRYIEEDGTEQMGYGFYRPKNPYDFFPDHECCTPSEIAAHKEACKIYDEKEKENK